MKFTLPDRSILERLENGDWQHIDGSNVGTITSGPARYYMDLLGLECERLCDENKRLRTENERLRGMQQNSPPQPDEGNPSLTDEGKPFLVQAEEHINLLHKMHQALVNAAGQELPADAIIAESDQTPLGEITSAQQPAPAAPDAQLGTWLEFEIGDLVLVSGEYEAVIISWNDDGTVTVKSEATGKTYNVEPESITRPNAEAQRRLLSA